MNSLTISGPSSAARLPELALRQLGEALAHSSYSYTCGATHNFYHYPARFSPQLARTVITLFSSPGEWVMDPFMGGGTAVIEALLLGRRIIGVDINSLAHFVTVARTTALGAKDLEGVSNWALAIATQYERGQGQRPKGVGIANLPLALQDFLGKAGVALRQLPRKPQRTLARCALLRLGQWAVESRGRGFVRRNQLARKLVELVHAMSDGLQEFSEGCRAAGLTRADMEVYRLLLNRSAVGLADDERILERRAQPRLVITSPPYPGVHVLYHRWQYKGRRETSAPYWIAQVPDGHYESHYTGGSRTPTGLRRYFDMIRAAFTSVWALIAPDGLVVQVVGFSDVSSQLPRYLACMREAGFDEVQLGTDHSRPSRRVPNRRWYASLLDSAESGREILLIHRKRC